MMNEKALIGTINRVGQKYVTVTLATKQGPVKGPLDRTLFGKVELRENETFDYFSIPTPTGINRIEVVLHPPNKPARCKTPGQHCGNQPTHVIVLAGKEISVCNEHRITH